MILRDYWFGCCFGSMRDMVVTLATVMLEKKGLRFDFFMQLLVKNWLLCVIDFFADDCSPPSSLSLISSFLILIWQIMKQERKSKAIMDIE
jgi:hypothetical protein